ncbi:MAG: DUF2244 domain-containing protein [Pseudomonadota bacterium]
MASLGAGPPHLELVLKPHRSLSPAGFWIIMAGLVGLNFIAGIVFWLAGAWPVIGFMGLDVALVYWAFRASYAAARARELVSLSADALTVRRVDAWGNEQVFTFHPYWLKAEIIEPPGRHPRLVLSSHGRWLAIGSFLGPEERVSLARTLTQALDKLRAGRAG